MPPPIWNAPRPRDAAEPNSVATIARMSIALPIAPSAVFCPIKRQRGPDPEDRPVRAGAFRGCSGVLGTRPGIDLRHDVSTSVRARGRCGPYAAPWAVRSRGRDRRRDGWTGNGARRPAPGGGGRAAIGRDRHPAAPTPHQILEQYICARYSEAEAVIKTRSAARSPTTPESPPCRQQFRRPHPRRPVHTPGLHEHHRHGPLTPTRGTRSHRGAHRATRCLLRNSFRYFSCVSAAPIGAVVIASESHCRS
jgi:hypothetical protein